MTEACERWAGLSDRAACGEQLSVVEAEFLDDHAAACALCAAEVGLWATLGASRDDPARLLQPIGRGEDTSEDRRGAARTGWSRRLSVGMLGAVAAALIVLVAGARWDRAAAGGAAEGQGQAATGQAATVEQVFATFVLVSGDVEVSGRSVRRADLRMAPGDELRVGRGYACLRWGAVSLCVDERSHLTIERGSAEEQVLSLRAGTLIAELEGAAGRRFVVQTPGGAVTVKGTIFATAVRDGRVEVRVGRGAVLVTNDAGAKRLVRASRAVSVQDGIEEHALDPARWGVDAARLSVVASWGGPGPCELEVASEPSSAEVRVGGVLLGVSPLSARLPCGAHELTVSHDGFEEERRTLELASGGTIQRIVLQSQEVSARDEQVQLVPAPPDSPALGPAALLKVARQHRSQGRYAVAATTYRTVITKHRTSAEAGAALLALGELELSQLHDPSAALRAFDGYLKRGGPLAQEARYGRIRALQQLGRRSELEREVERFLRDYPTSAQAAQLRGRAWRSTQP